MRRLPAYFMVLVLPVALGCQGPWSGTSTPLSASSSPAQHAKTIQKQELQASATAEEPPEQKTSQDHEAALLAVLDELAGSGDLGSEAKQALMADLREAKPENWPLIVRHFRSVLAYRQQQAKREQTANTVADQQVPPKDNKHAHERTPAFATKHVVPADKHVAPTEKTNGLAAHSPPSNSLVGNQHNPLRQQTRQPTAIVVDNPPLAPLSKTDSQLTSSQLTPPSATRPTHMAQQVSPQVLSQPPLQVAQLASHVSDLGPHKHAWQQHLQTAITDFQASVQTNPGSTDEVNEHMRLRLLKLLAGNEEAALEPIPGATAAQQDYWSKQLFAVSTFLDSSGQPNDKRRAASSLMHLDQARAKLSELATLQVRNLAFVDSVDGYGTYQLRKTAEFLPGEQVTLYTEIENFSSESTSQGYRTRLGTSYEIVDENGKRIDSDQFSEIEDLCQNPRRDFHIQYPLTLPTRIPADTYELRMILTDQHSHKIGQASIPFEITE